jgi:VWFA-related protein
MHRIPLGTLLAGMTFAIGASTSVVAQEGESPRPKGYRFEAEVFLIPVTVFVTDSSGSPVSDLTAEDFVLEEEGKLREIAFFQEISYEELARREGAGETPGLVLPGAQRQFLLLFDLSFSSGRGLLRARESALRFIDETLTETDLLAVATYSALGGLKILTNFTTDRVAARRLVDTLGLVKATQIIQDEVGFAFDVRLERPRGPGDMPPGAEGNEAELLETLQSLQDRQQRADDEAYRSRAALFLEQFRELQRALRAASGRKFVLFFSEGIDSRFVTGTGITQMDRDLETFIAGNVESINTDNRFGRIELRGLLTEALETAAAADVVVHTFDVSGLGGEARDHPGTGEGGGQDTLFLMANETGGRFYKNVNDLREPLKRVGKESSSFYLLGFYPRELARKGRFRSIDVEVKRPGVHLSHRRGYYEPTSPDKLSPVEKRLQVAEYVTKDLLSDDVFFDVMVATFPGDGSVARVPVFFKFPGEQFWESKRTSDVLQLELYGYAIDGEGRFLDFFNKTLSFDLREDGSRLRDAGFKYYDLLLAPPGPFRLKILARDAETGKIGSFIEDVSVPDFAKGEMSLTPPLFLAGEKDWVSARGFDPLAPEPRRQGKPIGYPFQADGEDFIPAIRPSVSKKNPSHFVVTACNLTLHPQSGQPQTEMKFEWLSSDGGANTLRKVGLVKPPRKPEDRCYELLFQVQWDDVPPGSGVISMSLVDTLANESVLATSALILEP